jgi:hypothetical protein
MRIRSAVESDVTAMCGVDHIAAQEGSYRQKLREWIEAGSAIVALYIDKEDSPRPVTFQLELYEKIRVTA